MYTYMNVASAIKTAKYFSDILLTHHFSLNKTLHTAQLFIKLIPHRKVQKLIVAVVVKRVLADYHACILSTCTVIPNSLYLQMTKT